VFAALDGIGFDADQAQQSRHRCGDAFAISRCIAARCRRRERTQDRERQAGVAARRIDRDVRRFAQAPDAVAVLAPVGQALRPGLGGAGGELGGRRALARGFGGIDPGFELGGRQAGKGEQQVGDVALGIDHDGRDPVERRFLNQ
jgi:hypothetical protein